MVNGLVEAGTCKRREVVVMGMVEGETYRCMVGGFHALVVEVETCKHRKVEVSELVEMEMAEEVTCKDTVAEVEKHKHRACSNQQRH